MLQKVQEERRDPLIQEAKDAGRIDASINAIETALPKPAPRPCKVKNEGSSDILRDMFMAHASFREYTNIRPDITFGRVGKSKSDN